MSNEWRYSNELNKKFQYKHFNDNGFRDWNVLLLLTRT